MNRHRIDHKTRDALSARVAVARERMDAIRAAEGSRPASLLRTLLQIGASLAQFVAREAALSIHVILRDIEAGRNR